VPWIGKRILIIGLGEIGRPLSEIVKGVYPQTEVYDIKMGEKTLPKDVDVLHICFPYTETFTDKTVNYVEETNPLLLLIESTVSPGTTNLIAERLKKSRTHIAHSPVRARKADGFKWGFFNYTKFIGPVDKGAGDMAQDYYQSLGFKTKVCKSPLETEYAKLVNLSYFAIMLGRLKEKYDINLDDILAFLETNTLESGLRFPRPVYDGQPIGGHCIIPAIKMLKQSFNSKFLEAVLESNKRRMEEWRT